MVSAHTLRLVIAALVFAGPAEPARALQLGESKAQTLARHGAPGAEDARKDVAIYYWDGWSAELEYRRKTVQKLIYRRVTYLEDSEVAALLESNGGLARWQEKTTDGDATRKWERDDGAAASCLAVRPLMMTFAGSQPLTASASHGARPTVVVSAPATPAPSRQPAFPKLLGSEYPPVEPALPVRDPLPKLPAEEVIIEPAPPAAAATVQPPRAPATPMPALIEAVPVQDASAERQPGRAGSIFGWLAFLAAMIGAGFYFFRMRRGPTVSTKPRPFTPAAIPEAGRLKSASSARPALAALRRDQCELLVGEIFRREGYTVELSAAAPQDDAIDLTLRRDGETILVQCKHWNTPRIGEREVREFHGAMMANGAPRGIFATTGIFTREAVEFSEGKQIDLMDRSALDECTAAVARPGENFCLIADWIAEFAAHARIFDPECPICQGSMSIRHNRTSGAASWHCRNHPRCPGRREPRLDLLPALAAH